MPGIGPRCTHVSWLTPRKPHFYWGSFLYPFPIHLQHAIGTHKAPRSSMVSAPGSQSWTHPQPRSAALLSPWKNTFTKALPLALQSKVIVLVTLTVWFFTKNFLLLLHWVNWNTLYLYWTTVKFCSPQCLAHRMYLIQLDLLGSPPSIKCCNVPSWSYIWGRGHKVK